MLVDTDSPFEAYHYDPTLAGVFVFAVLFGAMTFFHSALIPENKTLYFVPLLVGGIFEAIGHDARAASDKQPSDTTSELHVTQPFLPLGAPALFAVTIFITVGRFMASEDEESLTLKAKNWFTKVLMAGDVISLFLQITGTGLFASSHISTSRTGSYISFGCLSIQISTFVMNMVARKIFDNRPYTTSAILRRTLPFNRRRLLCMLYVTSACFMVQSILRLAEFVEGFEVATLQREMILYVFNAFPMTVMMASFNSWSPSSFSETSSMDRDRKGPDLVVELSSVVVGCR